MKSGPLVAGSKFLDKKWKQKEFQEHNKRMKDMKSEISLQNTKPYIRD